MSEKKLEDFLNMSLDQVMSDRFGRYSKYIIQGRALPDARDGLKPVQRRILFSMHELGLFHNKAYKKSARVVGDVIGKYHPHGDSSIYEAMVRMSQDWKMNEPLISMHGNNGSIDDDPAAAMRYTEARLAKISKTMLDGIKKETVAFAPNFDDSEKEPTVLPGLVPNLLVNGARGIAAGYATEMPPHNLGEVIDAIIAKIKSPNARLDTLMKFIKGPDFPTGGIVQGKAGIFDAFERGRGKVVIRSKYTLNESKTKPSITITEIPYGVVKSKMVREIDEIRFNKKISGIKEVRDETDRNGLQITIDLVPGSDVSLIANYLLAKTQMQVYYNYNNIAIKDNGPLQMGLIPLIDAYLNHQKQIQTKLITFDLNKDLKRLEIVEGLIKVAGIADKVIDTIRKATGSKAGVVQALQDKFKFTELQATAIAELRLYRLSRTDQSVYLEEREVLDERISAARKILESDDELNKHLINLLKDLKKEFATDRKTEVEDVMEKLEVNVEDLISHEDTWIGVSRQGYIKRFSNRAYEANELVDYGLKDMDNLIYIKKINTAEKLLVFTESGKYLFIPTHKIVETKFKDVGKHVNDFAAITAEDRIIEVISVPDFSAKAFIMIATANGKVKKTILSSFEVARYSKALVAMKLDAGDKVVGVKASNGFRQVILITALGKATRYSEVEISPTGTKSGGVKGIMLATRDQVTAMVTVSSDDIIGLVSKRGGLKRIRVNTIIPMNKKTQGRQLYRAVKGNPHITIDVSIVKTDDFAVFRDAEALKFVKYNTIDITKTEEGFSAAGPSQTIDGKNLIFDSLIKGSELFNTPDPSTEEDIFREAEQAIDDIGSISIDDILNNL